MYMYWLHDYLSFTFLTSEVASLAIYPANFNDLLPCLLTHFMCSGHYSLAHKACEVWAVWYALLCIHHCILLASWAGGPGTYDEPSCSLASGRRYHIRTCSPRPTVVESSLACLYATCYNEIPSEFWLRQDDHSWMRDMWILVKIDWRVEDGELQHA